MYYIHLHCDHHAGILVPAYQRVLPILCLRLFNVRPSRHKVLVRVCTSRSAGDGSVHGFHNLEIGGEKDIKVALVDLEWTSAR